ncbi:unnamed protein product [Leuciscus chuanchicus]
MIAKHDPVVEKKIKGQQNAKYTSSVIQNEILECLANVVREEIIQEVNESEVFSVIADETKDLKKEQLSLKWLDVQKEMYEGQPKELQKLSDTRWACRYLACRNLMDRLPALDLSFVSLLATFRRLLGDAKVLSDTLQSPSLDLAMAVDLVSAIKDSFQEYRSETFVDTLWKSIVDTATKCNIAIENAEKKRSQKVNSRLGGSVITSTLGQRKCNDGDKDSFRRTIFYPIVDTILGELDRRFSKDNCEIMRGIQALDPKSTCFLQEEAVFRLGEIYESDSEDLSHELHQTRRLLQRKQQSGMPNLSGIVELAVFLEPHKDVFHELFRLCKIAIALPPQCFD